MSILDTLFRKRQSKDDVENISDTSPVAAKDGDVVYREDVVSYILEELERRRDERVVYELQWTLNADFLAGHQNCDIDIVSRKISEETNMMRGEPERKVFNRIAPLMETRQANLGTVNYDMVVNPRTAELDDYAKARVSSKLLEYDQSITEFNVQKDKLIAWAELTGTAFSLSYWDTSQGRVIGKRESITEDGMVIYRDIREGEIAFGLISPYEVFPSSLTIQEIADQPSIIIEQVRDVGEVYDLYGLRVDGEDVENYVLTPIPNGVTGRHRNTSTIGMSRKMRENAVKVITYLENPSRDCPEGRLITIVRDKIVFFGSLPGGIMPLVDFKSKIVAGNFFGKSVIQDLIPYQRTYNQISNKILDHINTIAENPWLVPEGSMRSEDMMDGGDDEFIIEPGAILIYDPNRGKPEIVTYPNLPSEVMNERERIASDMEYIAGVSQLMVVGSAPTGVTSGTAIDNLRQIDSTRMSLTADNIRQGVIRMAKVWLRLNKTFVRGYRALRIAGSDESGYVYTWESEDINSYDIEYTAENELRNSKEQQKQDFLQAYQLGLFADENGVIPKDLRRRAWELFRVGDIVDVTDIDDLQKKNADRENAYLEQGVIPKRYKYDDDEIHLNTHLRYALSNDYRMLAEKAPEYAELFDAHIDEHRAMIAQRAAAAQSEALHAAAESRGQPNG